jgi:hypothetical protein
MDDDNIDRYTVTIFTANGNQVFNQCTEVDTNDRQLTFTNHDGKHQEFYGVSYHVAQE